MGKLVENIIIVLVLYLYIYSPPFKALPFNISLLFTIPAIICIYKKKKIKYFFSIFKIEILLFLLLCSYSFLLGIISLEFSFFFNNLIFLIQIIPVSIWIYYLIEQITTKKNTDFFKGLASYLGIIAFIAALISILGFVMPELGLYFKYNLQKYDEFLWRYQEHRGFGIADELLFSFAIVQGIILIIILYTSKNTLMNILYFILITFSIILNARIGLISLAFLPFILFRGKSLVKYIIGALLVFSIFYSTGLFNLIIENIRGPLEFASSFFIQTSNFLSGSKTNEFNTYDTLFGRMAVLPDTWYELIFGSGKNIFMDASKSTDVGYLLMLNFGGLIYMSIFALLAFFIFYRLIKSNTIYPLISYLIIFIFIFANIKGLFFAPKPGMKLIILLYVSFILFKKQSLETDKNIPPNSEELIQFA